MNRFEWILGGLLIVLLVIVAGLALTLWLRPVESGTAIQPAPGVLANGQTALSALAVANNQAKVWQADAQLLKATATWSAKDGRPYISGASSWAFTFYSPGATAVAQISVADNQPSPPLVSQTEIQLTPLDISGGWKIDSPQAVSQIMENGGTEFLSRKNDTSITMSLNTIGENGRMEWFVSLFDEQSDNFIALRMDATSGEVLEIVQKP
ncbi:MAG: hypothetical protein IPF56_11635 [Chloroflexi bacterium]|nr:hypothetical protein [Chloroflexota bacterium]